MDMQRRAFFKTVPAVAAGLATLSVSAEGATPVPRQPIADTAFPAGCEYPIRPVPFWDVKLKDDFQAKATLQSIIDNYKGDDDILATARQKLDALSPTKPAQMKTDSLNRQPR